MFRASSWPRRAGAALVAIAFGSIALGCGGGAPASAVPGRDAGASADAGTLRFDAPGVLTAPPSTSVTVTLHADVPGAISLALDGAYNDGSLAAGSVTAASGVASVVVRTPSSATTFGIHARSESGATADLAIAVGGAGFTSIGIDPTYSGVRASGTVVASAFIDTTCATLTATPLNDGAISESGSVGGELVLQDVPAGVNVALFARIGHYASGCIDAGILATGKAQELEVPIYDLPLALAATDLIVTLTPVAASGSPERAYWTSVMGRGRDRAVTAFVAAQTDARALLDAMALQAPTASQAAFTAQRNSQMYDGTTSAWLAAHQAALVPPASSLHDQVAAVLDAATNRALGPIVFGLAQASGGLALVSPATVDGAPASAAGWLAPAPFAWTADAHDNVQLSGAFLVQTSATLVTLATLTATSAGGSDVPAALASASGVDCAGLAASLTSSGASYPGCTAACTALLCSAALEAMWVRAGAASETADDITQVALVASGQARVGDSAQAVSFAGNWVSQISASVGNGNLDGTVAAAAR